MEELLVEGYLYTFKLSGNKSFIGRFNKIDYSNNTLYVSEYSINNSEYLPGIRTMPLRWIKDVELINETRAKKNIELSSKNK